MNNRDVYILGAQPWMLGAFGMTLGKERGLFARRIPDEKVWEDTPHHISQRLQTGIALQIWINKPCQMGNHIYFWKKLHYLRKFLLAKSFPCWGDFPGLGIPAGLAQDLRPEVSKNKKKTPWEEMEMKNSRLTDGLRMCDKHRISQNIA